MEQILKHLRYHIYWDFYNEIVYVRDNVKTRHINELRYELKKAGYNYKNLIIGRPDL